VLFHTFDDDDVKLNNKMNQPSQPVKTEKKLVLLQGGALVRHVLKKGGKGGQQLSVDDLNEEVLQARLKKLNEELKDYKLKCSKYKTENEWY
jgi:ribosomal 50S subunit-recycling heat shock protein